MKETLSKIGNAILIVGGFFVVFFGVQKASSHSHSSLPLTDVMNAGSIGVANADSPGSSGSTSSVSSGGDGAGSGDSGSSDSGGK